MIIHMQGKQSIVVYYYFSLLLFVFPDVNNGLFFFLLVTTLNFLFYSTFGQKYCTYDLISLCRGQI